MTLKGLKFFTRAAKVKGSRITHLISHKSHQSLKASFKKHPKRSVTPLKEMGGLAFIYFFYAYIKNLKESKKSITLRVRLSGLLIKGGLINK